MLFKHVLRSIFLDYILDRTIPLHPFRDQVKINNQGLECIDKTYLGIKVNSGLTMTKHIDHLFRTAFNMVFTLYKIRHYIDVHTAVLIFKAHVLSNLSTDQFFVLGQTKAHWIGYKNLLIEACIYIHKLIRRPRDSTYICLRRPRDSYVFEIHTEAKALPLKIRRNIVLMKLMYNLAHSEPKVIIIGTGVRPRSTGSAKIPIPFPYTEWFRKSIAYQGPSRWLNLPNFLKI